MSTPGNSNELSIAPKSAFVTTQWSVVLAARDQDPAQAEAALATLCGSYWFPIYAFVRRRGFSPHDAEDLTQEFFARLIGKKYLDQLASEGGKFRSFLLTALKHFLANEWNHARTQKRGGALQILSWDALDAEHRYTLEPADQTTPEDVFDRRWALVLLNTVMQRLEAEYTAAGKADLFARLQPCITGGRKSVKPEELSAQFGTSAGAVRVAVHRLRRRYGELLREEIARTVGSPDEVDAEIRFLITAAYG
ncbi:MAG: sigma-70 family RNA polymerase sigma factor [Verrucomicrobiota bacterium]